MRVLYATAEVAPIAVVGGPSRTAAWLTAELRRQGVDVDIVVPDYESPHRGTAPATGTALVGEERVALSVPRWAGPASVRVGEHPPIGRVHLVSTPGMARSHPYLRPNGLPWPDNAERFLAFSQAIAALVRREPPDVLHLNDWPTGAVLAAFDAPPPSLLSVHDVADQGITSGTWLSRLGPRAEHYEWWGGTNPLSGAIALADAVVARSPTHAQEMMTAAGGYGLEGPLRDRWQVVSGIVGGIDTTVWDPATDPWLVASYGPADGAPAIIAAKAASKRAVLDRFGWPDDSAPLAVAVTRLAEDEGVDLIVPIVGVLRQIPMRLVVLGSGEGALAGTLAGLAADHPDHVAFVEGDDEALAHLLIGGADLSLTPSRLEPGGEPAMRAMRYGTVPVVTAVGGLRDTVPDADFDPVGRGFVADRVDSVAVVSALFRAARCLADRRRRPALVRRIIGLDWSWRGPAGQYIERYEQVISSRRG